MLFDIKLEEVLQSSTKNVIRQFQSHRFYILISVVSLFLVLYSSVIIGAVFFFVVGSAYYLYDLYLEVSAISFSAEGIDFDLQDVINDLEGR